MNRLNGTLFKKIFVFYCLFFDTLFLILGKSISILELELELLVSNGGLWIILLGLGLFVITNFLLSLVAEGDLFFVYSYNHLIFIITVFLLLVFISVIGLISFEFILLILGYVFLNLIVILLLLPARKILDGLLLFQSKQQHR